jgi:limonene-1,2-epoxide hydrolase
MAKFDLDGLPISQEEKYAVLKALTDKKFREELERRAATSDDALDDEDLEKVVGGAGTVPLAKPQVKTVLTTLRKIDLAGAVGTEILCTGPVGGGPAIK